MRIKSLLFLFVCISCIISCVSGNKKHIYLTDNSKFDLLPAENLEKPMDMAQFISAEFGNKTYFFYSWVKADKTAIEMTVFNELGASMGELSYNDGKVKFSSTVIPKSFLRYFKPEYIVTDFQLCFYDPVMLGKALEDSGLVLEIQEGKRRILDGNEVIIEIAKTDKTVSLKNNLRGYAYTLEGDF